MAPGHHQHKYYEVTNDACGDDGVECIAQEKHRSDAGRYHITVEDKRDGSNSQTTQQTERVSFHILHSLSISNRFPTFKRCGFNDVYNHTQPKLHHRLTISIAIAKDLRHLRSIVESEFSRIREQHELK